MTDKQKSTLILVARRGMGQGPADLQERLDPGSQLFLVDRFVQEVVRAVLECADLVFGARESGEHHDRDATSAQRRLDPRAG